ncbi:MAG: hypothetical protein Q8L24_01810 [bacterium]|nr:hypothetical protein [bacterium]
MLLVIGLKASLRKHGRKYAGKRIKLITWRRLAQKVTIDNLKEIPAEFTLRDLFEICREERWIIEAGGGMLKLGERLWK